MTQKPTADVDRRLYRIASRLIGGSSFGRTSSYQWIELTSRSATMEASMEPRDHTAELSFQRFPEGWPIVESAAESLHPRMRLFAPRAGPTDPVLLDLADTAEAGRFLEDLKSSTMASYLLDELNTAGLTGSDAREVIAALAENRLHWWPASARHGRAACRAGNADIEVKMDILHVPKHGAIASVKMRDRAGNRKRGVGPTATHPLLLELARSAPDSVYSPTLASLLKVGGREHVDLDGPG